MTETRDDWTVAGALERVREAKASEEAAALAVVAHRDHRLDCTDCDEAKYCPTGLRLVNKMLAHPMVAGYSHARVLAADVERMAEELRCSTERMSDEIMAAHLANEAKDAEIARVREFEHIRWQELDEQVAEAIHAIGYALSPDGPEEAGEPGALMAHVEELLRVAREQSEAKDAEIRRLTRERLELACVAQEAVSTKDAEIDSLRGENEHLRAGIEAYRRRRDLGEMPARDIPDDEWNAAMDAIEEWEQADSERRAVGSGARAQARPEERQRILGELVAQSEEWGVYGDQSEVRADE